MRLGSIHAKNKLCKTVNGFLRLIGVAIIFLTVSSFASSTFISKIIATPEFEGQEKIQSPTPDISIFNSLFMVALEVEEVEESKEERHEGSTHSFIFCSPSFITANNHLFFKEGFSAENRINPMLEIPLYILYRSLRIPFF
ncbi:hypothetical protein [Lunatibacter salilacus]|uniref:hypothetical protein n=1 Tax=Lunatibacter salilacus TaxID=2483804 RepID=UPI00131B84B3|nr:hypothetical protein [Lunatibacter salilacus]